MDIRETTEDDFEAAVALHAAAFPEEDLTALVRALLTMDAPRLAIGVFDGGAAISHVVFTLCGTGDESGALLGPLAVAPAHQKSGHGGALIREGKARLAARGVNTVFVLGDPAYYGRFGFEPERRVSPPYALPKDWADAWRSAPIGDGASMAPGVLRAPPPWRDPALWR